MWPHRVYGTSAATATGGNSFRYGSVKLRPRCTSHSPFLHACYSHARPEPQAMTTVLQVLLSVVGVLAFARAQAPGDGSVHCLKEYIDGDPNPFFTMQPVYGDNERPLMDSRHYMSLLIGDEAVWQQVDADSNNTQGVATNVIITTCNCALVLNNSGGDCSYYRSVELKMTYYYMCMVQRLWGINSL